MKKEMKDWQIAIVIFVAMIFVGCFLGVLPRPVPCEQNTLDEEEIEELQTAVNTFYDSVWDFETKDNTKEMTGKSVFNELFSGSMSTENIKILMGVIQWILLIIQIKKEEPLIFIPMILLAIIQLNITI